MVVLNVPVKLIDCDFSTKKALMVESFEPINYQARGPSAGSKRGVSSNIQAQREGSVLNIV
jgi:hypothetical protein